MSEAGSENIRGATPPIQNPRYPNRGGLGTDELEAIAAAKSGDDDHPADSDRQICEAMNAEVVNAIAGDPDLWGQSAIVITYDESDGFFDHAPPRILSYGPDRLPLARGVRVPRLLISPFARAHAVSHAEGDHNAVIETINAIFGMPALSQQGVRPRGDVERRALADVPTEHRLVTACRRENRLAPARPCQRRPADTALRRVNEETPA
jgi:phospholipase C